MAYSTGSPANARAVTANSSPGAPSSAKSPFLVPTSSSVISSSSRDRGQDVDAVVRGDRRLLPPGLAVDEHVDVAPDPAALVEDPPAHGRALALQHPHELADGAGLQRVLRRAGHRLQLSSEPDERHFVDYRPAAAPRLIAGRCGPRRGPAGRARRARGSRARGPSPGRTGRPAGWPGRAGRAAG